MNELEAQVRESVNADHATPSRLWDAPDAPLFYPQPYFIRKLTMLRDRGDGIPEVVVA